MTVTNTAYISLGSNMGDRGKYIFDAIDMLTAKVKVSVVSPIYETEPVGLADQSDFLNNIVRVETDMSAEQLLELCQEIEFELGRKRIIIDGPRTIDLDIILFNDEIYELPHLEVPHPRAHQRRFVLQPLVDIAPNLYHPTQHKTIKQLLDDLPNDYQVKPWINKN